MGVCDIPVISTVCDTAGEAAASLISAPFDWLASAMGEAAGWMFTSVWTVFDTTTLVDVTGSEYVAVVDAGLATSVDGIFAAGDCAAVRWYHGARMPEQLWYTARDQGRAAARRLCGDANEYARGLWYNSAKLMDIEYTTAGLVSMNVEGERTWSYEERGAVRSTISVGLMICSP